MAVHPPAQRFGGDGFHDIKALAGTEASRRRAVDRSGREQVVERDERRSLRGFDVCHGAQGDHLPALVAHPILLDVVRRKPLFGVSLREDHEVVSKPGEEVDVSAAQVALQRIKNVADRHAQRFGLGTVHLHRNLRDLGAERRESGLNGRIGFSGGHERIGLLLQAAEVVAAIGQLELHLEATRNPKALDRRRDQHEGARLLDPGKLLRQAKVYAP
jgi:hypothetical protein